MTAEKIAKRGSRTVLARNADTGELFYYKDGERAVPHYVIAKSYSMSYLKKLAKFNA
jgi:hypothetical protein